MTMATLGLAVQSGSAVAAAADLDKLVASAGKAERSASGVGRASREMGTALQSITSVLASIDRNTATMAVGMGRASAATTELGTAAGSASAQIIKLDGSVDAAIREMAELRTASTGAATAINAEATALRILNDELRENASLPRPTRPTGGMPGGGTGNQFNTGNIAAQLFDVGVTAPFMNPLQVGLQQGAQLSQAFAGQTMKQSILGVGSAIASLASPISLATIGLTTLTAVGIQWGMAAFNSAEKATDALKTHGDWLDRVLRGYDDATSAAGEYLDKVGQLPIDVARAEVFQSQQQALADLETAMNTIIEKQVRIARGDTSGMGEFALQVEEWQARIEDGTMSVSDLQLELSRIKWDPSINGLIKSAAAELDAAAGAAAKFASMVDASHAALLALAGAPDLQFKLDAGVSSYEDALAVIERATPELRTQSQIIMDTLAAANDNPVLTATAKDVLQDKADTALAAIAEQERVQAALRAARAGGGAGDAYRAMERSTNSFIQALSTEAAQEPKGESK